MTFTYDTHTGLVTVDFWQHEVSWTLELLAVAHREPYYLRREGDRIVVKVENGEAEYLIEGEDPQNGLVHSRLVSCTLKEATP